MAITVTLRDVKNIKSLTFTVPKPGAYLLTGTNGAGKTSLLTCLSRLRNRNAFQVGFRSSAHKSLDSHRGATVEYKVEDQIVTYGYTEERGRWNPVPRKNSKLLETCPYPTVQYIAADANRVQPQEQEFSPRNVKPVKSTIRTALNTIFSTQKFSELCYLSLNRGSGQRAYLIKQSSPGKLTTYYSERNFSLGELCVLKLLLALDDIEENSLVLIDELELATHPRAQTHLFDYLNEAARKKTLTIIFSTHSVSLIKNTDRRQVLFLQNNDGVVECTPGCFPTYTLGHLSSGEETAPDNVIYVEDDSARKCVQAMLDLYNAQRRLSAALPTSLVMPIGGFRQILDLLDKAPRMLPKHTKVVVSLDQDVETESLTEYTKSNNYELLALFNRLKKNITYLPWTPEVGFVDLVLSNVHAHEAGLKKYFNDFRIVIPHKWGATTTNLKGKALRDACKKEVYELGRILEISLGRSNDKIREDLFKYLVLETQAAGKHDLLNYVGRLVH